MIPRPNKPIPKKQSAKKKFTASPWTGEGQGEKIILYGVTKMGKTTLASMIPDPVFIGVDDGGRKIRNPKTGEPIRVVEGIETFQDVRDSLLADVFDDCKTIVVDTITFVEQWGLAHTLATVPKSKGGAVKNIHDYGYHEGFTHWQNTMLLLLQDFDRWVRSGKNVLLLAQETTHKWKTSDVEDFLMAGPELHHSRTASTLLPYMEWADHILRLSYANRIVDKNGKINPVKERCIQVQGDATFFAGSRTIPAEYDVVSFTEPKDNSIWRLIFGGSE